MTTSDFLMLISILVAIVSIVEANNKKIWLYKFCSIDLVNLIFLLAFVCILIKYDGFLRRFPFLYRKFYCKQGIPSTTWAFIISITTLIVFLARILLQKCFPKNRRKGLLKYYKRLIHSDINLLIDYLYQYHIHKDSSIDDYILPIYTDKTFIRKSVDIDQTVFLKLLVSDKEYKSRRITYDVVGFYTTCVVPNEHGQFLQELTELDAFLWINSMEKSIMCQIESNGVFEEVFKDKTFVVPSLILTEIGTMAIEQLLYSSYFDEEPSVFLGLNHNLFFNTYLQLYFVILCYYISIVKKNGALMSSCYFLENKLYYLLPKEGDL